jgi:uncharacterized protein YeaO (DUF488 family)
MADLCQQSVSRMQSARVAGVTRLCEKVSVPVLAKKGVKGMIRLKRAYEPVAREDGTRLLVERLWPRGVRKDALRLDAWLKDVAPSTKLRQWFGHDPAKWPEFQRRYRAELDRNAGALDPILKAAQRGRVTLIYSSHDQEHNNAVVLKTYIESRLAEPKGTQHAA